MIGSLPGVGPLPGKVRYIIIEIIYHDKSHIHDLKYMISYYFSDLLYDITTITCGPTTVGRFINYN